MTDATNVPKSGGMSKLSPYRSKLGIHLLGSYTQGARRIIHARPRVIKVLDPQAIDDMQEAVREYKQMFPQGLVVMRVWEGTREIRYEVSDDPVKSAEHFWSNILQPAVERLPPSWRRLVDYLEGPNECDNTPCWRDLTETVWLTRFWSRMAERIAQARFRPCVANIPVGNPPGTLRQIEEKIVAFIPALRVTQRYGGVWSYHAYSLQYTTDPEQELWLSLRYRLFYQFLTKHEPRLANLPMILTEGGIDRGGNPQTDGWRARGSPAQYKRWLLWYDTELQKDPYLLGVTLFQIGDPSGWWSFDLEPIADWMAQMIA